MQMGIMLFRVFISYEREAIELICFSSFVVFSLGFLKSFGIFANSVCGSC